jgi:hypothetical protein
VTGDSGPAMLLFSRRNDVTLANPRGPGGDGMGGRLKDAGSGGRRFRDGHLTAFDILTRFVSDDLACYHELERGEAMLGRPFRARVVRPPGDLDLPA